MKELESSQKIQLEITNWPKASSKIPILTVLVALLGYGFTWYVDRQTTLQKIHDDKIQFERQQLQASIDRKMVAYEKVETAISNIRRIWYIARAKCAYDKSYATDPRKIEAVNLERWNARIDLMAETYNIGLAYGQDNILHEIYQFNEWEAAIQNVCAKDSPTENDYRDKQANITNLLVNSLLKEQNLLGKLTKN